MRRVGLPVREMPSGEMPSGEMPGSATEGGGAEARGFALVFAGRDEGAGTGSARAPGIVRGPGGGGGARGADGGGAGQGELAGLPESDEGFETGEDADQAGGDEGVQDGERAMLRLVGAEIGDEGGDLPVQGRGGLN